MKPLSCIPFSFAALIALLALLASPNDVGAAPPGTDTAERWPPLAEVAARIRSMLPEAPEPVATETSALTYVRSLAPLVLTAAEAGDSGPSLVRSNVYANGVAYLRAARVAPGLRLEIDNAWETLSRTQPLVGVVLDLRFADGLDYGAAAEAAGAFASRSAEAFRLGSDSWRVEGREGGSRAPLPLIVLVNRQTRAAAEALAAAVRSLASPSLVIGTNTAGQARSYRTLTLAPDLDVRVAADALQLPDGSTFPSNGLAPDLTVAVSEIDERAYLTDEFQRVIDGRPANHGDPFRLTEAELVRQHRHPQLRPDVTRSPGRIVQDPVLARAIDLLSGRSTELESASAGVSR